MWKYQEMPRTLQIEGLYTAFEAHYPADHVYRGETHNFAELVLVKSGKIGVTAGVDSFLLEAGSGILHPPMEFHSLRAEGGTAPEIIIFSFWASRMPEFSSRIFSVSAKNIALAEGVLSLLERTTAKTDLHAAPILSGMEQDAQCAVLELELLLLKLSAKQARPQSSEGSAGFRNYRRALAVIAENLDQPLDTAELAARCNISTSLLKKLFSHYAGIGVMEYFRQQKINSAIPLLRAGKSVQEVAEQFGFSDAGYFSTVFRRVTGRSPTYYRTS